MNLFNVVALAEAEQAAVTVEEAATVGVLAGLGIGAIVIGIIWFILQVIADWRIFTKAGEAGWKSIIPIYHYYVEYGTCWKAIWGLVYGVLMCVGYCISANVQNPSTAVNILSTVCSLAALVISVKESINLAKAFGKGTGFTVGLVLFGPIFRLILGLGSAKYVGNPEA